MVRTRRSADLLSGSNRRRRSLSAGSSRKYLARNGPGVFDHSHPPFYPSSSDRGFAVIDHRVVDHRFGSWANISSISSTHQVMADLVLNHVSSSHRWVEEFRADIESGRSCLKTASLDDDVSAVVRPRTSDLLVPCETTTGIKYLWCTFGPDQVDLDWEEPEVLLEMLRVIDALLRGFDGSALMQWLTCKNMSALVASTSKKLTN